MSDGDFGGRGTLGGGIDVADHTRQSVGGALDFGNFDRRIGRRGGGNDDYRHDGGGRGGFGRNDWGIGGIDVDNVALGGGQEQHNVVDNRHNDK